jgi:hypothetical protein
VLLLPRSQQPEGSLEAARLGQSLPTQLIHYLEVLGRDLEGIKDLHPRDGVYGGSPAATIAMAIHSSQPSPQTRNRFLKMVARCGGALPTMTQLDVTEMSNSGDRNGSIATVEKKSDRDRIE